jgi:hypothetical protein
VAHVCTRVDLCFILHMHLDLGHASSRSRWSRHGTDAVALTARDLEIFLLLHRYRYLRADFIHAFVGGSFQNIIRRLNALYRKPNFYLRRPEAQRMQPNANYRYLIYELDERAAKVLRERGLYDEVSRAGDYRQFSHAMMVNDALASIELGMRRDARLLLWRDITEHEKFPAATRKADKLQGIPVRIHHQFGGASRHAEFNYISDGLFGIRYGNGKARFFQLEAEHRNRIDCSNLHQTSFLKKYLAIQYIMEERLFHIRWGIPNMLTLVVTPSQERIEQMKKLILRETAGKGAPHILFREIPVMEDIHRVSRPMPELFGAWQRAGYEPLDISQP